MTRELADDVTAVLRRLAGRLDELVARVLDEVWVGVEGYRDTLTEKDDLGRVIHHSLEIVLNATSTLRPIGPDDLADSERLGETRALQGFPATSLVQSYRTAERCLVGSFLDEAAELDGPSCARGTRAVTAALDQLEHAALLAHRRTEQAVALAHETTVAALLTRLASGIGIDDEVLTQQAAIIDIDPDHSYVGVAVFTPPSTPATRLPNLRRQLARRLAELERSKVLSVIWQGLLLFLVPRNVADDQLIAVLRQLAGDPPFGPRLVIGVGDTAPDLVTSGRSFRHAAAAAHLGSQQGLLGEVVVYADVALQAMLAASHDTSRTIVEHRLGELLRRPELLRTMRAFIDCDLSVQASATALDVHPNTVSYRLRQIARLLDIDVRRMHDLTDIDIALRALDVLPPGAAGR